MQVRDLIKFLETCPQDATVSVWSDRYEYYETDLDFEWCIFLDEDTNHIRFIA